MEMFGVKCPERVGGAGAARTGCCWNAVAGPREMRVYAWRLCAMEYTADARQTVCVRLGIHARVLPRGTGRIPFQVSGRSPAGKSGAQERYIRPARRVNR